MWLTFDWLACLVVYMYARCNIVLLYDKLHINWINGSINWNQTDAKNVSVYSNRLKFMIKWIVLSLVKVCRRRNSSGRGTSTFWGWWIVHRNTLKPGHIVFPVLSQDLHFQRYMSWSLFCSVKMRGACLLCWNWWNWWP